MFTEYVNYLRSQGKRSFTYAQILNDLKTSIGSVRSGLYRLKKEGVIISPAKGLFVIVPPESQPYGSIPAEELVPILMKYLNAEYYVALLSAATFYGAAHQKPARFQIITHARLKHTLTFGQVKLEIIYKKDLRDLPFRDFTVATGYLKVASPELVIYDLLKYSSRAGGLNHIATVIYELQEALNITKLLELATQLLELPWLQRLGFILEKIGSFNAKMSEEIIGQLKEYLNQRRLNYIPLASELPRKGRHIKKWKIIQNTTIESDL